MLRMMAIFFDLDGTLLDHSVAQNGGLAALGNFSSKIRDQLQDDFLHKWQEAEARHFIRYERGEISIEQQRRERLRECFADFCLQLDDSALDDLYQVYLGGYRSSWSLYPDALKTLQSLPGPKALITNGDSKLQRAKIDSLGINELFQGVYISGDVGVAKPDARIFNKACNDLGLPADQVSYVGDNFRNDIEGSAAAGLCPIWINREKAPRPSTSISFREIHTLQELLTP